MNLVTAILVSASVVATGGGVLRPAKNIGPSATIPEVSLLSTNPFVWIEPAAPFASFPQLAVKGTSTNCVYRFFAVPAARQLNGPHQSLAPGVYKTEPYACLVVVPGRIDERCVIANGDTHPGMPVIQPELRMVPWQKK